MADSWYQEGQNGILAGAAGDAVHAQPNLFSNDIRVQLRDEVALALDLVGDIDLDDVDGVEQIAVSDALAGKTVGTVAAGVFDHTDEVLTAVSGAAVQSIEYFDFQTAVASTSPLLWNIDGWTGLPLTPNGGDVTLAPAAGGVYALNAT